MNKAVLFLMGLSMMVFSGAVRAEDPHPVQLGSILGNGIDLKLHDHAFAGAIRTFVAWGYVDEATFSSDLMIRKDGQLIHSEFKKQEDGRYGGQIQKLVDGKEVVTPLYAKKVIPAERKILFDLNGQEVSAVFQPESMSKDHLVNPTVTLQIGDQQLQYRIQGEGCYGFLMFNTMMILGAWTL